MLVMKRMPLSECTTVFRSFVGGDLKFQYDYSRIVDLAPRTVHGDAVLPKFTFYFQASPGERLLP